MPPERRPPDDPREWLNRAHSNLALAEKTGPDIYLEDLCFHSQQAAEKGLKALLLHRSVRFPYVHDLAELMTLLEKSGLEIPEPVRTASALSRYAVATRYPGLSEPVTQEEHQRSLDSARAVVSWVERQLPPKSE